MTDKAKRLSEKSVAILTLIAEGHSCKPIVDSELLVCTFALLAKFFGGEL